MTASRLNLPTEAADCRPLLEQDPLNADAARRLADVLRDDHAEPARAALWEACAVLNGGGLWNPVQSPFRLPHALDDSLQESLILHPGEKQQRHHKWVSLLSRLVHLLEGDAVAHTITRVTAKATPDNFPHLCRSVADWAGLFKVKEPAVYLACGEDRLFSVMVDRQPFLCIHLDYLGGNRVGPCENLLALSSAELRFGVCRQLQHVRSGHAVLMQLSPERLEGLLLNELPFFVRHPVKLATRTIGLSQAGAAVKKVAGWLPGASRTQKVVQAVGDILPEKDQETVLPEAIHQWVRSWVQAIDYSADRAGLVAGGSVMASCSALLRLSPVYAPHVPDVLQRGARWLLTENAADRPAAARLRELLQFAFSEAYLGYVVDPSARDQGNSTPS